MARNLILKSPGFVPFDVSLAQSEAKYDSPVSELSSGLPPHTGMSNYATELGPFGPKWDITGTLLMSLLVNFGSD